MTHQSGDQSLEWMWVTGVNVSHLIDCELLDWMWPNRVNVRRWSDCDFPQWLWVIGSYSESSETWWVVRDMVGHQSACDSPECLWVAKVPVSYQSECEQLELLWVTGVTVSQQRASDSLKWLWVIAVSVSHHSDSWVTWNATGMTESPKLAEAYSVSRGVTEFYYFHVTGIMYDLYLISLKFFSHL